MTQDKARREVIPLFHASVTTYPRRMKQSKSSLYQGLATGANHVGSISDGKWQIVIVIIIIIIIIIIIKATCCLLQNQPSFLGASFFFFFAMPVAHGRSLCELECGTCHQLPPAPAWIFIFLYNDFYFFPS